MADTSITSSPSKLNGSIRETRLKRRNKRLKIDQSLQLKSDHDQTKVCFRNMLNEFYKDSDDESSVIKPQKSAVVENFKPFEFEKTLVMADQLFIQQSSSNIRNVFPETQGFITCTQLDEINNKYCCTKEKVEENQNESFIITETELINCCDQAEQLLQSFICQPDEENITLQGSTPNKNDGLMLVNSILKDFSQSPLQEEQISTYTSWQYTPEFRLRKIPVKSYSRKHHANTRANLNERFKLFHTRKPSADDDSFSFCSSLSVQEDDILPETVNNLSVATSLDNTDRLCENLLNLTEYFTQNEINQSIVEDQKCREVPCSSNENIKTDINLRKIPDLIKEILSLRLLSSNTGDDERYNSSDDFYGFGSKISDVDQSENQTEFELGQASNNKATKVDISFEDWSEEDLFVDINTENILLQNNIQKDLKKSYNETLNQDETFTIPNRPISTPACDKPVSFNTASAKPIKVSREAHKIAAKILSSLPDIPDSTENKSLDICDKRALKKDENVFENPEDFDDEWNDDCDLFINFQTPAFVKNTQNHLQKLIEISHDDPCTSKSTSLGFTTAAGKTVSITDKGLTVAQKLLMEIAGEKNDNKNYEEELKERKLQVYAKTHNTDVQQSSFRNLKLFNKNPSFQKDKQDLSEMVNDAKSGCGFSSKGAEIKKSVSGLDIFSKKNIVKPANFGIEQQQMNEATDKILNPLITSSAKVNEEFKSLTEKELGGIKNSLADIKSNENVLNKETQFYEKYSPSIKLSMGFQTANGKKVSISAKAKQIADKLLKEINKDEDIETCEKDLENMKTRLYVKNKNSKENPESLQLEKSDVNNSRNSELIEINQEHNNEILKLHISNTKHNTGFQTVKGKQVSISVKAEQAVKALLEEFTVDMDVESYIKDIKDIKTKNQNKNKISESQTNSPQCSKYCNLNEKNDQSENSKEVSLNENCNINLNMNVGFQTANGQKVAISTKAREAVGNILKEFTSAIDIKNYATDLREMKLKLQNKNKELAKNSEDTLLNLNNSGPKKRKESTDSGELESLKETPPVKLFKSNLQSSKSLLAEQSLKSPLMSATRSIISRKNLLSLTKKRKNRANASSTVCTKEIIDINKESSSIDSNAVTPLKPSKSMEPAPITPNLKEFLTNASLTSTPRLHDRLHSFEDSDLKPIVWQNNDSLTNKPANNSLNATKLSQNSATNISFNSSNPTAKERIGRLKMYGKAPDVSPILIETNHNCRPSGLRRTRSMLKKSET